MTDKTETLPPVGAFLATSWGYDQTNVDFYKVVGHTKSGKSVRLQKWSKVCVSGSGSPQEGVVPGDAPAQRRDWDADPKGVDWRDVTPTYIDCDIFVHRARWSTGFASTTVRGHYAHVWDGRPAYQTGAGWGH